MMIMMMMMMMMMIAMMGTKLLSRHALFPLVILLGTLQLPTRAQPQQQPEDPCVYYTAQDCQLAAQAQGLEIGGGGFAFDVAISSVKGCYFYQPCAANPVSNFEPQGRAFFGPNGTRAEMEMDLDETFEIHRLTCNTTVVFPEQDACNYYDAASCRAAAEALGLDLGAPPGMDFSGPFSDPGCHYFPANGGGPYAGRAFFGEGYCNDEMEAPFTDSFGFEERLDCQTTMPCTYYTATSCRQAALALGLQVGQEEESGNNDAYEFTVEFTNAAGCFYYPPNSGSANASRAYFGTGGSHAEIEATLDDADIRRLDCNTILPNDTLSGNTLSPTSLVQGQETNSPASSAAEKYYSVGALIAATVIVAATIEVGIFS